MNLLKKFWNEEDGQDMVEYALLLALISVVAIGSITLVGQGVDATFSGVTDDLTAPAGS